MYGVSIKQNLLGMTELLGTRQPDSADNLQAASEQPVLKTGPSQRNFKFECTMIKFKTDYRFQYFHNPHKYEKDIFTYTIDFTLPNGILVETKGRWVAEDRKKHLLMILICLTRFETKRN